MDFNTEIENQLLKYNTFNAGIEAFRYFKLQQIHEYFSNHGFPERCTRIDLSLIPAVFQETNYGDINWTIQNSDLRHMNSMLELDCMFHNEGKIKSLIDKSQFNRYVQFSLEAIRQATNR